jgi:hypothetical protein
MRELTVRALLHRNRLGDDAAIMAADVATENIDNPVLRELVTGQRKSG